MNDIYMKISQLVDNELNDEEQVEVFGHLADKAEARESYSKLIELKKAVSKHHSQVETNLSPLKLEKYLKPQPKVVFYKIGLAFSSAAAVLLMIMLFSSQKKLNMFEEKLSRLIDKYDSLKNEQMQQDSVKNDDFSTTNLIASENIKAVQNKKMNKNRYEKIESWPNTLERIKKYSEISLANSVTISKDDFIGGQIVSN